MSTIYLVNVSENSPPNPLWTLHLNNPAPPQQSCPQFDMLSYHLFEGDLLENKTSESNILAASENLVIESLILMREKDMNEEY